MAELSWLVKINIKGGAKRTARALMINFLSVRRKYPDMPLEEASKFALKMYPDVVDDGKTLRVREGAQITISKNDFKETIIDFCQMSLLARFNYIPDDQCSAALDYMREFLETYLK